MRPRFFRASALLFLIAFSAFAAPVKVLEDKPGRLSVELGLSDLNVAEGEGGAALLCAGCQSSARPGAPDVPVARFSVVSPAEPQVSLQILASETRRLPQGVRPYPETPTPSTTRYVKNPVLYRAPAAFTARVSAPRSLRAAPVRVVEVPLALWDEGSRTLTILHRVKVDVSFPGVRARPATAFSSLLARGVLNPQGGKYLVAPQAARPSAPASVSALRKRAVTAALPSLGDNWIKIKIGDRNVENMDEDRVYAVTGAELRQASPDFIAVKNVNLRVYGGPNDTLSRRMGGTSFGGTLRQEALEIVDKDGSGTLDDDDTLKFFAHGASIWKRTEGDSGSIRWEFSTDPYSFENYYFLTWEGGAEPQLHVEPSSGLTATGAPRASGYHYLHAERDLQTGACDPSSRRDDESGFDWFWFWKGRCDTYSDSSLLLTKDMLSSFETDSLRDWVRNDPGDTLFVGMYTYPFDTDSAFFVFAGADTLRYLTGHSAGGSFYAKAGPFDSFTEALPVDSVLWGGREKRLEGYTVVYKRKFAYHGKPQWIFPERFGERVSYKVEGAPAGLSVLRIEGGEIKRRMALDAQGVFTDSLDAESDGRYYLYGETSRLPQGSLLAEALPPAKTALRDLEAGDGDPDYIIVTSDALLPAAVALRDYRNDAKRALPLKSVVVRVEDIYRQFSGGRLSPPAIRDFLRWAYNGWGKDREGAGAVRYVLFFGDGNYDYRNIKAATMLNPPPSIVPPYEFITDGGREEVATDDFYGWLDLADSSWDVAGLDVALGRVPVQTDAQARHYIAKIQDYENPVKAGEWRGRVVMTADDYTQKGSANNLDPISRGHTNDTEKLGHAILDHEPGVTLDKIYLLDYPLNSSWHKPEATQDLLTLINRGSLLVNYVGHGSSNQWADEVLLQTSDALSRMHNKDKTPMINAFSCTVGRFESLIGEGMSEQLVKQSESGAIAAISATRESFPLPNIALADAFYTDVFPPDSQAAPIPVGEALRAAKVGQETAFDNLNDMKYSLLGEPVMLLRKPQMHVSLTQAPDTIKALDCSVLKGKIAGGSGNGYVNLKILAGTVQKAYVMPPGMDPQYADKRGNILFERTVAYRNGEFATDYFIPKQISFGDTNAQVLAFAWDTSMEAEGSTARQNLRIQGTAHSSCPADDGRGPRILVTGCEPKETGGIDLPDNVRISLPYCLQVQVEDSSGGVLSAEGPDEGTTLEIPGTLDPFHPQPGIDDLYRKTYQLSLDDRLIRPGNHLLKVSARDGYGNISRRQINMDVTLDSTITAFSAYNVPNPLKRGSTMFYFSGGMPANKVEVTEGVTAPPPERLTFEVRIFDQRGYMVRDLRNAQSGQTAWDGTDEWGKRLGNGVYFYKVIMRQNTSLLLDDPNPSYGTVASKRNVLVISR